MYRQLKVIGASMNASKEAKTDALCFSLQGGIDRRAK